MTSFNYTLPAQEIIFGSGTLSQVGPATERYGWRRLMVCTSPSLRPGGHLAPLERALGSRLAASYEHTLAHVLDHQLAQALALASEREVEAVIGLGGGSPIGLAKALSWALEERRTGRPARARSPLEQPLVPVIAIPTTYAGSEMTPVYGITHRQADGLTRKVTVRDTKIAPRLVIYDPGLTLGLPASVTAGTGINALAHCLEALYSTTANPLSTAAALAGLGHIARALPRCHADGHDLVARTEMLQGAHLAGASLATVAMGAHHGLCHALGGTAGVPHGVANAIMLPHVLRFNQAVAAGPLAQAAEALGVRAAGMSVEAAAEAAIGAVSTLIARLGLPQRLREVEVSEADLPGLARLAAASSAVQANPRPMDAEQAEAVFRAAW